MWVYGKQWLLVGVLSLFCDAKVSKKGICPSFSSSIVKLMSVSMLFSSLYKSQNRIFVHDGGINVINEAFPNFGWCCSLV